jgi:peptidyl-tRNA hydrolase
VLSEFKKDEQKALLPALENACKAIELLVNGEIDKAMNLYNS